MALFCDGLLLFQKKLYFCNCNEQIQSSIIKADMMEPQTGIVLNMEAWTEGRMILSDEQWQTLKAQIEAFLRI